MVCAYCGGETAVVNSRHQKRNNQVWRRRKCLNCQSIFTTHEAVDLGSVLLVEQNGVPTPFLPDLLHTELLLAMQDRKDLYTASRELLGTIVRQLTRSHHHPLFKPKEISQTTASVLKRFDKRAYLRYVAEHPSLQI